MSALEELAGEAAAVWSGFVLNRNSPYLEILEATKNAFHDLVMRAYHAGGTDAINGPAGEAMFNVGQVAAAHEIRDRISALDERYQAGGIWLGTKHDMLKHGAQVAIKYAQEVAGGPEADPEPPAASG